MATMKLQPQGGHRLLLVLSTIIALLLLLVLAAQRTSNSLLEELVARGAAGTTAPPRSSSSSSSSVVEVAARKTTQTLLPTLASRVELGDLLQKEDLTVGAELGVLVGDFAHVTLQRWTSCTKYYLVDLWGAQENYKDLANADASAHEKRFQETKTRLTPWDAKTEYLRMYTTEAAKKIPDNSLDYVYVDARHDYCGVMEDLKAYWPKLKSGGIFAGHDYISADAQALKNTNQDWSVCMDGSVNMGAVKGAVDEFLATVGLTAQQTTGDGDWPSWMARKP